MHKLLATLAAPSVILSGASVVIAQQAPRAEQDQQRPNAPIQGEANPRTQQGPANESADEPRVMRPAARPNNEQSRGPIESKKGLDPTTPKGDADRSASPPKN